MFNTAVLFIIYKNPPVTRQVFERIREIRPARLYISADGPKLGSNDKDEIDETRNVTELIDWDCKVFRRYSNTNLGCKIGVTTAINWFFENEENGVILEYDCLPSEDFFRFCSILLEKYKDDTRITSITGNNFDSLLKPLEEDKAQDNRDSYYFGALAKIWGWATWRRSWQMFDINLKTFKDFEQSNNIALQIKDKNDQKYWLEKIKKVYENKNRSTWGFIWVYTHLQTQTLCITPHTNLVSNIGFNEGATHAQDSNNILANIPIGVLDTELRHPSEVKINSQGDHLFTSALIKAEKKESMIVFIKSLVPQRVITVYIKIRSKLISIGLIKYKKGWQV